jgi:4-hydroxy-tetrahydrodipicolinate synthase
MVTPFTEGDALAVDAVHRLVGWWRETGAVAGLIPGDLVGEVSSLTLDERRVLLAETVKAAAGDLVVIALVAAGSLADSIALARFARDAGADLVKLGLPCPYTPEPSAMLALFRQIDDAVRMPFLVESSDELPIPLPVLRALCERETFVGLEELGTDLGRLDRLHQEFASRLALLPSGETALLFLCLRGAPGLIAAEGNFAPRFMAEFLGACRERQLDRALGLFGRRRRYRDLFRADLRRGVPAFTPYAKAALGLLGWPVGRPRLPHEPLTPEAAAALREVLAAEFGLTPPGGA